MLGKTEQEMGKLGGASQKADKGMAGLGGTFGKVALLLGGMKLGQTMIQLGALGAEAQRTEASFTGVAGGAEKATAMLDALKIATNGTKSEVELMSGATTIMALGLGKTADEIGTIMRNVEALGARFGGNMQTFQLMMSNDSLMRIDSFGIGVEEATKRIEEYKKAGMEAGEAFDTAVMELMTEKFESLGGVVDDNKASIDRMKASLQDLKVEIGQGLAPTIGTLATNMGDLLRLTNRAGKEYGSMGWQIADMLVEAVDFADWIHTSIDDMEELEAAERGYRAETARLTGQAEEYIAKVRQQAEVTLRHQIAMRSTNGVVVESLDVWKQYERAQAQSSEATQAATRAIIQEREALKLAAEAADRSAQATRIIAAVNSDFSDGLDEQTLTLDELRQKQAATRAEIDKLNASQGRAVTVWSKAAQTEAEATLTTLQLADAQSKLAAETDPLKAAQLAVKIEDLQGKLGGASVATTTFIDNTKKVGELEGVYDDLQAEIDAVTAATYKSVNAFMFQQMVSRMAADGWSDAELAMLDVLGQAAGIDTTFIKLAPLLDDAAAGVADIGTEAEVGANKGKQLADIAGDIAFRATEAGEAWSLVGAAYEAGGIHGSKVSRELRDDALNLTSQFIDMGNAWSWGFTAVEGAARSSLISMADIPPKIAEIGDAAVELGPRFVDFATAASENLGAVEGAARSSAGGLTLIGNQALWAQEQIDKMHGKEIDVLFIYRDEDRRKGAGAGATSIGNPYDTTTHEQNASGGWLNTGSVSLVGERGPELIYATSAGVQIEPLSGAGADGGTRIGSTWTGDIVIQGVSDPEAAANAVIRKLADRGIVRAGGYR
ncbi:MAG: hypothetical protein QM346_13820 [Chloroflexota bacterium]|nr:hypothetical protein [Chloroflexota bacterium]